MPKVIIPAASLAQIKTLENLVRWVSQNLVAAFETINGRLTFGDNIQGVFQTVEFAATTSTQITHNLGRPPIGYIVVQKSDDLTVYDGTQAADSTNIYLQASAAGTAKLFIF